MWIHHYRKGTPVPGGRRYPSPRWGVPQSQAGGCNLVPVPPPLIWDRTGVPPPQPGQSWGTPPPPFGTGYAWTGFAAGGTPLDGFAQEDCFVLNNLQPTRFLLLKYSKICNLCVLFSRKIIDILLDTKWKRKDSLEDNVLIWLPIKEFITLVNNQIKVRWELLFWCIHPDRYQLIRSAHIVKRRTRICMHMYCGIWSPLWNLC